MAAYLSGPVVTIKARPDHRDPTFTHHIVTDGEREVFFSSWLAAVRYCADEGLTYRADTYVRGN